MRNFRWILGICLLAGVASCKKDEKVMPSPEVTFSVQKDTIPGVVNEETRIVASVKNHVLAKHTWKVGEEIVSTDSVFTYTPKLAGTYLVAYNASNESGSFSKTLVLIAEAPLRPVTPNSSAYISEVFEYLPAPGQFINKTLGDPAAAQKLAGGTSAMVSLGAFGGYIVFGFDHSILNAEGNDLAIFGNPAKAPYEWAEPGIVMVSSDANANGLPDDEWYELAGSEYHAAETVKNYTITYYNPKADGKDIPWKDNLGNSDVVMANNFHRQNYYPLFASNQDSISFTGTLLKNTFGKVSGIFVNASFPWGYSDSWSSDDDYEKNRYNSFDISNAVNGRGEKVALKAIDFVKVYTAQNGKGNAMMGEISTEVKGAADISLLK